MLLWSNKKLHPLDIGQTVLFKTPVIDRGCMAPRNVLGVVKKQMVICTTRNIVRNY